MRCQSVRTSTWKNRQHFSIRGASYLSFVTLVSVTICQALAGHPVGVEIDPQVMRSGDNGDNWCMTWGEDGALYTAQCDGRGWLDENGNMREFKNTHIWRITGGPDSKSPHATFAERKATFRAEMMEVFPDYSRSGLTEIYGPIIPPDDVTKFVPAGTKLRDGWNWYGYGLVSVGGNMYQFISHCAERYGWGWFDGTQLIWRPKGQKTWKRWNGTDAHDRERWLLNEGGNQLLFFEEPEYAFSFVSVAQFGRDYRQNRDEYIYLYSPEGKERAAYLNMARVKKAEILNRDNWEYFSKLNEDGSAEWVKGDISRRGVVHHFPDGWGFYSWLPSVVWNEQLGLFIMATGGTQRPGTGEVSSSWPHSKSGSLMFLWAEKPWGPWHQFFWKENWQAGEEINRLYLPQLSPKWISDDGTVMHLIFSDAANGHSTYYKWNMQRIRIKMSSY